MKCLRCGKEMKNGDTECSCGHFYETNLKSVKFIPNDKNTKPKRKITIIEIFSIVVLITLILNIIPDNNSNKKQIPIDNEQCEIKCEGLDYEIKNNKCKCSNGVEYIIE